MDLREIAGLDLEGARELMLAFATDAKRIDREMTAEKEKLALWTSRVALAESKGIAALAAGAKATVAEIEGRIASLAAERGAVQRDAEQLRQALPGIGARSRSIDPDRLLAELQLATGELLKPEATKVESAMRSLEKATGADDALTALKRKMGLAVAPEGATTPAAAADGPAVPGASAPAAAEPSQETAPGGGATAPGTIGPAGAAHGTSMAHGSSTADGAGSAPADAAIDGKPAG